MKLRWATATALWVMIATMAPLAWPGPRRTALEKGQVVDAGSFGVFVNGRRMATETFRIEQHPDVSIATADFKLQDGSKGSQQSELQITPAGNLRHYEWHEVGSGKAQLTVEPNNEFLLERVVPNPPSPPSEQTFLLPISTMVLDDYFFSHREILAWRYLAQSCEGKLEGCKAGRLEFGVLLPAQRSSITVALEYAGTETITVHGQPQLLNRINFSSEAGDWILWLDGNLKLIRILIPADNTEVVRD
jgi:hypothetical protein